MQRTACFLRASLPLAGSLIWTAPAAAEVPAFYTGTPYQGTPQEIPGRVELADMDLGGINVAWFADHHRSNSAGYQPISGNDYRSDDQDLPNICKTNRAVEAPGEGSEDFWEDGTRYPSEESPYVYYMGYAHTVDWVRLTVDVKQAGTYTVSSEWACANPRCGYSLWFNDGTLPVEDEEDGNNKSGVVSFEGTNDYHKWRAYPNQATVELSAGVQLLTFNLEEADHLQYGFLQFDLVGAGGNVGMGGAPSMGGADTGGAPAASAGMPSAAGGMPAASAGSSASAGSAPVNMGSAGAPTAMGGSGTGSDVAAPGAAGMPASPAAGSGSSGITTTNGGGCAVASVHSSSSRGLSWAAPWALVLGGLILSLRKRALRVRSSR